MILKKNFYFVRHGQTETNALNLLNDERDVPLTAHGRKQALVIRPIIEQLPIQTICVSPLLRARETKDIIAQNLLCEVVIIEGLRECTGAVWEKIDAFERTGLMCKEVESYQRRVIAGLNKALEHPDPILVVAHGGFHWVMSHHMDIIDYQKEIGNCVPVYFSYSEKGWAAKHLATPLLE
ncbi:MAG TPA: histidine phosphatase family protein [Rhabdochlamydiaceae bacterium]|nr:histidine phosphatase family protein [Rhabdochlamydiaceae bacterium]